MVSARPVVFRDDGLLVRRAVERLGRASCSAEELAGDVLGLRGPDAALGAALRALLGDDDRFVEADGHWSLRPATGRNDGSHEAGFAVVDVETTGTARGARVTEVAVIPVSSGAVGEGYATLIDPGVPIPPRISRLTGITNQMVRRAPAFGQVASEVRSRLDGRIFVAHNAAFDWRFVRGEFERIGHAPPDGRTLCTVRLARALVPGLASHGLDSLSTYFGLENEARHRAAGDATATAHLLLRLLDLARDRGIEDLASLERFLSRRRSRTKRGRRAPRSMEAA